MPLDEPKLNENRISTLDGLRALAILLVLGFHYTVRWAAPRDPAVHLPDGAIFNGILPLEYGWFGVELFFVVSGFVILMTLERCSSVIDFVVRRFARIWPALVVAASLTTLMVYAFGPLDWRASRYDFVTSLVLVDPTDMSKILHRQGIQYVDGAYWSLWVEVRFYALAALAYLIAGKRFIALWLAFSFVVFAASIVFQPLGKAYFILDTFCFPTYLPYLTFGLCLFECYTRKSLSKLAIAGMVASVCETAIYVVLHQNPFLDKNVWGCLVANGLIFSLFTAFAYDSRVLAIFRWRPIVALGQASYSLYLLHQYIGVAIMREGGRHGIPYLIMLPTTVALMMALGFALTTLVEKPAKAFILGLFKGFIRKANNRIAILNYSH